MHKYKKNFDDNCEELTILRWFRDNYIKLPEKFHYYKVAPQIVEGINNSKYKLKYYEFIYDQVVKACVEAIKSGDFKFAYNRYKRTVQFFENKFVLTKQENVNINIKEDANNQTQQILVEDKTL